MSDPKPVILPPQRSALAGLAPCTDEWYVFFRLVVQRLRETGVDPAVIADIEARLAALEAAGGADFLLQGLLSVEVVGSTAGGLVQLSLVADEAEPASTHYYGTSPAGPKGYHPISDAVEADAGELTKAVDGDGVTSFGLADVPNGGDGAFQLFFRDAKGRVVATTPGDSDDVPEGTTNLYFTAERAQDAVGSILVDSATINFTYDDTANTITAEVIGGTSDPHDEIMIRTTFGF